MSRRRELVVFLGQLPLRRLVAKPTGQPTCRWEISAELSAGQLIKTVCEKHSFRFTAAWKCHTELAMDILKMLAELHAERQQIDQAILVVERLAAGTRGKRRGRPPKWMSAVDSEAAAATAPRKKRAVSAAARKRMAAAQKRRWAAKRAQASAKVLAAPG